MKRHKLSIIAATITTSLMPAIAYALTPAEIGQSACNVNPGAVGCGSKAILGKGGVFESVVNAVIMVGAAIAVLMIIIGGLRYTLSGGDSSGVKGAKDTIIYALVGLVVSMLAFVVVNFVIGRL